MTFKKLILFVVTLLSCSVSGFANDRVLACYISEKYPTPNVWHGIPKEFIRFDESKIGFLEDVFSRTADDATFTSAYLGYDLSVISQTSGPALAILNSRISTDSFEVSVEAAAYERGSYNVTLSKLSADHQKLATSVYPGKMEDFRAFSRMLWLNNRPVLSISCWLR